MAKRSTAQGVHRVPRLLLLLVLLAPLSLHAETTPLQVISSGMRKPEIMIVLDTSGSMHRDPGVEKYLGADCDQSLFNIVDLPGDGVCSGSETATPDCNITSNTGALPGSARSCLRESGASTTTASRMYSLKRVLRGLLPGLRSAANFGLITYGNTNYYQYYRADQACICDKCPVPHTHTGACTALTCASALCNPSYPTDWGPHWTGSSCKCWKVSGGDRNVKANSCNTLVDATCQTPPTCTATASTTNNCSCQALDRTCKDIGAPPCCSCPTGSTLRCTSDHNCATCRCELDSYTYSQCCDCSAAGAGFTLSDQCYQAGAARNDCRCRKPKGGTRGGYHWKNATCACPPVGPALCDPACATLTPVPSPVSCVGPTRKPVTTFISETELKALKLWVNEAPKPTCDPVAEDCGWRDRAQNTPDWTGVRLTLLSGWPTGWSDIDGSNKLMDSLYRCTSDGTKEARWQWSAVGRAHSTNAYGCSSWEYVGSYYTYLQTALDNPSGSSSCSSPNCQLTATYRGPQFLDGAGVEWVYRRFAPSGTDVMGANDIDYQRVGMLQVPIDPSSEQMFQDNVIYEIIRRLNLAKNGGIYPQGYTPTASALKLAGDHFLARQKGTAPFTTDQQDFAAACRRRFVIVLTDGDSNASDNVSETPPVVAQRLYKGGRTSPNYTGWNELTVYPGYPDNPITTLSVGVPGLDSYTELNDIADRGADGLDNATPNAYAPTNETELVRDVRAAITKAVSGDYVTTSLGVANTTTSVGTMAIIASTKFPEWEGQLRAFDLTASGGPALAWDAGSQLYSANADVGFASRRIYTGYPTVNNGIPIAILNPDGTANLSAVLAAVAATGKTLPGTAAQQQDMLRWIAGKGRNWRLAPIFNSVPATIGAEVPGYSGLTVTAREPLIYVTSHDGLLHAFRGRDGAEVFAYLPPNLLPRIFDLWVSSNAAQRQSEDPEAFRWILGSSPRVQDVPSCTGSTCTWQTNLVLTMGASDNAFVVLDVTNPVVCTSSACSPSTSFFRILGHSHESGAALEDKLGETWSVPTMFFGMQAGSKVAHMSMGSGYPPTTSGPANQGNYYFHFTPLRPTSGSAYTTFDPPTLHAPGGQLVDYAVLADTAGLTDSQKVGVATYQADLLGRVTKYPLGAATGATDVISGGPQHPFYYSPAVYDDPAGRYLVAISGSAAELVEQAGVEGKVYVLKNDAAFLSFALADICTQFGAAAPNCPSTRARPVAAPLLVKNDPGNAAPRMEMFFAVYDPPPSSEPCASGVSYVFRFHIDTGVNPPNRLLSVHKYDGRAAGLTIVGGGIDVALGISGRGAQRATVVSLGGRPLGTGAVPGPVNVMVGSWREVP